MSGQNSEVHFSDLSTYNKYRLTYFALYNNSLILTRYYSYYLIIFDCTEKIVCLNWQDTLLLTPSLDCLSTKVHVGLKVVPKFRRSGTCPLESLYTTVTKADSVDDTLWSKHKSKWGKIMFKWDAHVMCQRLTVHINMDFNCSQFLDLNKDPRREISFGCQLVGYGSNSFIHLSASHSWPLPVQLCTRSSISQSVSRLISWSVSHPASHLVRRWVT